MYVRVCKITDLFDELLSELQCDDNTKSYIISIYAKYKSAECDMSKDSITLRFAQAKDKHDFYLYQNLGDWLFYTKSMFPSNLKNASENFYNQIAQLSYYNCYKIVRSWKLYEQLADEYIPLTNNIRNILLDKKIINTL